MNITRWVIGGLSAYAVGAGAAIIFGGAYGGRYGSNFHQMMHHYGKYSGRIGHVRCVDVANKRYVKVFGLVCEQCGYVSVNRILDDDFLVEDEICGRDTGGFCWTSLEKRAEGSQRT